jgi:hypothetical protein
MNTLTITIGILDPVITFLIGRYFRAEKAKELDNAAKARDYWHGRNTAALQKSKELTEILEDLQQLTQETILKLETAPKFQLVANKDKHPAANDNYLYIEGEINGNREAGLFKLSDWSKAKERLLKNPEYKPNNE